MKKLGYFVPAILFTAFYALIASSSAVHPIAILWLAALWVAGIFLSKGMFWGGFIGFIPGACFIYMGTQDTGQIIKETPMGIIIIVYYAICIIYCAYIKKKSQNH